MASPFPPELSLDPAKRVFPRSTDPRAAPIQVGRYAGPAYPFGVTADSVFGPSDDVSVLATSLVNIITTPIGSAIYDLSIGSQVPLLLFEPLDPITIQLIRHYALEDVERQEPRIIVDRILTDVPNVDNQAVFISAGFRIVGDPTDRVYNVPVDLPLPNVV